MKGYQHRRTRPLSDKMIREAVEVGCLARGCICTPEVYVHRHGNRVAEVQVAHDDACPVGRE